MPIAPSQFREMVSKKSFEIGYALFRVGSLPSARQFAASFGDMGIKLLTDSAVGKYDDVLSDARALEYMLRLAENTGALSGNHSQVIIAELEKLNAAIAGFELPDPELPDLDLKDMFSPMNPNPARSESGRSSNVPKTNNPEVVHIQASPESKPAKENGVDMKKRQEVIVDLIRQSGNCRMKEIEEALPDSSERTLRYDIQDLVSRGLVERVGAGGPSIYYRLRTAGSVPSGGPEEGVGEGPESRNL